MHLVNFASKLTLVLGDVKVGDLERIGDMMAHYLFDIYKDDPAMTELLKKHFDVHPCVCFSKLKDRSIITTLNHTQWRFLEDGYRLYGFIKDGVLHTLEINRRVNRNWLFTEKINGKTVYYYAAEKYEQLMKERYQG